MVAFTTGFAASAKAPEVLQPSGKWGVNYADKKCVTGRSFGEGRDAVMLVAEQFAPGEHFKLALIGERFGKWTEEKGGKIQFGPHEAWQDIEYFVGNYGKGKGRRAIFVKGDKRVTQLPPEVMKAWLKGEEVQQPPVTEAQLAAIRTFSFKRGGREVQLATGRLDRVVVEMNKCLGTLVKSWGFDPDAMARLRSRPVPLSSPGRSLLAERRRFPDAMKRWLACGRCRR